MKNFSITRILWILGLLAIFTLQPTAQAVITYNDGGTHELNGAPTDPDKQIVISNATTVDVTGGGSYLLKGFTVSLSGGSTLSSSIVAEILGGQNAQTMKVVADNSTISLKYMTANDGGITLSNDSVVKFGEANTNANYGAFLGNGTGGFNVTSGTASIYFLKNNTDVSKGYSFGTLRDSKYKITISEGATLELYGGLRSHNADSKIVVNGAGTLNLNAGEIGSRLVGTNLGAGELSLQAGTTNWKGATLYTGTQVTLSNTGTTLNLEKASALNGSGTVRLSAGTVLNANVAGSLSGIGTITGSGTVNAKYAASATTPLNLNGVTLNVAANDALQNAGKITVTGGKIVATEYTTISNGMELINSSVSGIQKHDNYGSYLFLSSGLKVSGGTATAASTSSMDVASSRMRKGSGVNSEVNVAEYTTLNYKGSMTYDNANGTQASLAKTGKGTLNFTSGTIGAYYADAWGPTQSTGKVLVEEGTLKMSGAKFYTGETVTVAPTSASSTATLEGAAGLIGSKITYNITGTPGLTTPNAILSLTVLDPIYQNYGTVNLTNALMTNAQFSTVDSEINMTNSAIESTGLGEKLHYGSMILQGSALATGKHILNVLSGTNSLTTMEESNGVRLRGSKSEINVADGATLNVASGLTYDNVSKETGIIKMGGGLMNVTRGTIGGFASSNHTVDTAGVVRVNDGTLRMSGNSTLYSEAVAYVADGGTLDLNTSATLNSAFHLAGAGDNGMGALLFSNDRTVTNSVYLDKAASIGVADNVVATISFAIPSAQALTKVGKGTLVLDTAGQNIAALQVQDGTMKLSAFATLNSATKTIRVSGANSVLELAANDAINYGGNAAGANGITIENGGTITNTSDTYVTLTRGFTLNNGTLSAVGQGNTKDKGEAGWGLGLGYGNYLLTGSVAVQGNGVSTIDAYRVRLRNGSNGNITIAPTATLETSTKFDTDNASLVNVSGGGTLHATADTFTTPGLKLLGDTSFDVSGVSGATTGSDWTLLSTTSGNESLGTLVVAQTMSGSGTTNGLFTMETGRLSIDLAQVGDALVGQTLVAAGFDINGATLELNLADNITQAVEGSYKLFSDDLIGDIVFSNLWVTGANAEKFYVRLNGNVLSMEYIPEPASWLLLVLGLGLLLRKRVER